MVGERVGEGRFSKLGLEDDRRFAVRDLRTGRVVSAKTERRIAPGDRIDQA